MKFSSFLDIKNKNIIRELKIIKEILSKEFLVEDFLNKENPYLFLKFKNNQLQFEGLRIYKVGSNIAYRVQNYNDSEPYGKAYPLNLEEAFEDLVPDSSEEEAAKIISDLLVNEFERFYELSCEAQNKNIANNFIQSNSAILIGNNGDYSNSVK